MKRLLIFNGQKTEKQDFDIDLVIENLKSNREYMHSLFVEDIIDFFNELMDFWKTSGLVKKNAYLKNLSDFFARDSLSNKLKIALHNDYTALDKFVDLGDQQLLFHAQPRGLTAHWLAGNVPVLGLFSIFFALVTKNVCLVKSALNGYNELINLLDTLNQVKTKKINGKDLAKSIVVALIENNDKTMHEKISMAADVRIAWGGHKAIEAISGLKKNLFCEDIIFGPKYSYAVIDQESLSKDIKKLAQKLAIDVSVFDQYACSSPHTVFIQEKELNYGLKFAEELAKQLDFVNRALLPKAEIDPGKAAEIVSLRSEYEIKGKVFSSAGTAWTVVYTDEKGLAKGCFSRVIFVKPITGISELKDYNDRQKQTLGLGLTSENKIKYADLITLNGIDRCPDLGYLTFYESPWDGMFVFDRLVRWVTMHK